MRNYDKYKKQNVYKKDDFSIYTFLDTEEDDIFTVGVFMNGYNEIVRFNIAEDVNIDLNEGDMVRLDIIHPSEIVQGCEKLSNQEQKQFENRRIKMKNININIRTTSELKAMAESRANEEGRTLSNYIEYLIRKDAEK